MVVVWESVALQLCTVMLGTLRDPWGQSDQLCELGVCRGGVSTRQTIVASGMDFTRRGSKYGGGSPNWSGTMARQPQNLLATMSAGCCRPRSERRGEVHVQHLLVNEAHHMAAFLFDWGFHSAGKEKRERDSEPARPPSRQPAS